jgi:uncharacterized membrane protein
MGNRLVYSPVSMLLMLIFAFLLFAVVGFLFLDLARTAFTKIGFSWGQALFVLLASLFGSSINIPVTNLECSTPLVRERYVRAFGIAYRVPVVDVVSCNTLLAVNVGGAVIPTLKGFGNCHSRSSSATRCGNSRAPFGLRWGSPA